MKARRVKKSKDYDVITCGSATVDVFAHTESELVTIKTSDSSRTLIAYPSGSKILIKRLQHETGGGGTNTAVGFSRLGLRAGYVGCVGDDEDGHRIVQMLADERVDFLGQTVKEHSGYSVILDSIEHDRTILTYKGANDELSIRKISSSARARMRARLFYFSSLVGDSFQSHISIARSAKKAGSLIAWNPSFYQCKAGMVALKEAIALTDILIFNKEESQALTGKLDRAEILSILHGCGIRIIVITDGPHLLVASDGTSIYEVTPQKVPVLESTGAGDAFSSGFCAAYVHGKDIMTCLQWGLLDSQSVLGFVGAKPGLLSRAEMIRRLVGAKISCRTHIMDASGRNAR